MAVQSKYVNETLMVEGIVTTTECEQQIIYVGVRIAAFSTAVECTVCSVKTHDRFCFGVLSLNSTTFDMPRVNRHYAFHICPDCIQGMLPVEALLSFAKTQKRVGQCTTIDKAFVLSQMLPIVPYANTLIIEHTAHCCGCGRLTNKVATIQTPHGICLAAFCGIHLCMLQQKRIGPIGHWVIYNQDRVLDYFLFRTLLRNQQEFVERKKQEEERKQREEKHDQEQKRALQDEQKRIENIRKAFAAASTKTALLNDFLREYKSNKTEMSFSEWLSKLLGPELIGAELTKHALNAFALAPKNWSFLSPDGTLCGVRPVAPVPKGKGKTGGKKKRN